jgi:hypothetical protein
MVLLGDEGLVELCLVRLGIVLLLMPDCCMVCVDRTVGSKIVLEAPNGTPRRRVMWNLVLIYFEIVLASVQDRCTVCTERTIGIEIVLDTLDGTPM